MTLIPTCVRDITSLNALSDEWWRLWRACRATPFQSPAWLLPWWLAFAPGQLLVLAIHDEQRRLRALAPLYVDDCRVARPLGVSVSDYLDVLIDPDVSSCVAPILEEQIACLLRGEIDRLEMPDLRPGAAALSLSPDLAIETANDGPCPVLYRAALCGTLTGAVPANKRRKLRMAHRRADRFGDGAVTSEGDEAIGPAFEALVALHGTRWDGAGGGVLQDPRTLAFHRAALPALDRAGLLQLLVCRVGDKPIGVYYGLRDDTRAYAYIGGYDPGYATISPGSRLLDHAIRTACEDGLREFHFLRGGEAYKYDWGAVDVVNVRRVFHPIEARVDA